MNYKLKKDEYLSSKRHVWKSGACLGYILSELKEKHDIDWSKYRKDKTLKMSVRDRLVTKYNAISYPDISCGQHSSLEEAVLAIQNKQQNIFDNLKNYDIITIGGSDV